MAKVLPLTILPSPLLHQKSQPIAVAKITQPEIQQLISDMEQTMKANNSVGLAAVQVGKLLQLALIETQDGILVLINPQITSKSWLKNEGEEGCLSVPDKFGLVKRLTKIKVSAYNQQGKKISFTAKGFFARVIQHEVDHINGILFIDRTKKIYGGPPRDRQRD